MSALDKFNEEKKRNEKKIKIPVYEDASIIKDYQTQIAF